MILRLLKDNGALVRVNTIVFTEQQLVDFIVDIIDNTPKIREEIAVFNTNRKEKIL